MDSRWPPQQSPLPTSAITILSGIVTLYLAHSALVYYFDSPILSPILSPLELVWNALVFLTPQRLVLDGAKRAELRANDMLAQTHAAKSEALRRVLGMGGAALTHKLVGGEGIMRGMSGFGAAGGQEEDGSGSRSDVPPGLGNWDNSCYQNSVLQGLSSLDSLKKYLGAPRTSVVEAERDTESTTASLQQTVLKLRGVENNGNQLWTPAKLKNMSSWQQQDAQEYFSKIMEDLDKEAAKGMEAMKAEVGLEAAMRDAEVAHEVEEENAPARNPLEGLLAQRVACTRCGFSEGLSMIPFNCLTVPLGSSDLYSLQDCLDEYTKLEEIPDVDCPKCTLLRAENQLQQMLPPEPQDPQHQQQQPSSPLPLSPSFPLNLPPELRLLATDRLNAIQQALQEDDFTDTTLTSTCQIPKKAHVSSTKTRQAVIARAPQALVIHINRSVFDERTGVQRKNYAGVGYPAVLDLGGWMFGGRVVEGGARVSILDGGRGKGQDWECLFRLKAVIQHYGRHENGHYIAYRRHPAAVRGREGGEEKQAEDDGLDCESGVGKVEDQWWRLSDEDVSPVSEDVALGQGGAFMLFYEREGGGDEMPVRERAEEMAAAVCEPMAEDAKVEESPHVAMEGIGHEDISTSTAVPDTTDESTATSSTLPPIATPELPTTPEELSPPSRTDDHELSPLDPHEPVSISNTSPPPPQHPQLLPSSNPMRTARGRQTSRDGNGKTGFGGNVCRAMAAT
ncbi:ubiquitin-specific protease ubp1 [Recurvomyces mirabilis]|uniref:ubiquitinyl hydrolase 1 n=1 Tax=Recurvomyces mirabilis TaxID=574656 RepID=A0AAE0WY48_9PEZI|nr:ubiquitin-specific protease ubp1 [Recurvomyces mirabilis]KAK5162334.1 ubiquitin-specific protease ubp1 [Recurvomyces mirabilis]